MFKEKSRLEKNPLLRFCPKPNCTGMAEAKNIKTKKVKCNICGTKICFKC